MNKRDFPKVHFYDQDFVDIYDKTWSWIQNFWFSPTPDETTADGYLLYETDGIKYIDQFESIFSSFFLVYSNRNFPANQNLDYLYERQEETGAIHSKYDFISKKPVFTSDNPKGIGIPLFAWAEFNLYHKSANKKRVKDVMPILQKYSEWLESNYKRENGLYSVPFGVLGMPNSPRTDAAYFIDFNSAIAVNALYMSALGDILNDKDLSFQYKRSYFSLKTRINSLMWDSDDGFYYDLDEKEQRIKRKTIAGFFPLLAEIPNEDKADRLVFHLTDPAGFGTDHPYPTLAACEKEFSAQGEAFCGSVYPAYNFIVLKGLEKYQRWDLARESAIRHLYYVLEGIFPEGSRTGGDIYEAYLPTKEGFAHYSKNPEFPKKHYIHTVGLSTIAVMIENVIGLSISLPRKTVDWIIPNLEIMGIENLSLKRNMVTILSNKSQRGWEIHMESEKLYYFTIHILGQKKKTLPIPSGKCSMLIDKL